MALKAGRVGVDPSQVDFYGRIKEGGGGGGSVDLYQHNVRIAANGTDVLCSIINSDSTAFTFASLTEWLSDNGFNNSTKLYPCLGYTDTSKSNHTLGMYVAVVSEVKNIQFVKISGGSTGWNSGTVSDIIINLGGNE